MNPPSRENFRRGITPNIRMRKDAVGAKGAKANVEAAGSNGAAEPFLKGSKEDEEEMEKEEEQRRKKEVQ